jgi:hypothetical protein
MNKNLKKIAQLGVGTAIIMASACDWHFWHIADGLAVIGLGFVGEAFN